MRNNRWMVFVAAVWMQACSGIGYLFGSVSPVLKAVLGINQRQLNTLGVAKDLGDSVGFVAGFLSDVFPTWVVLLVGGIFNALGYGCLFLIVTRRMSTPPFWMVCALIFVGTNGETFFNTASLVSCVQTFPAARGPVVGILKGFSGLSGAIFTRIYTAILAPDQAAFLLLIAVGPFLVAITVAAVLRPIRPPAETAEAAAALRRRDGRNFNFMYAVCLILAAYLLAVMVFQDMVSLSRGVEELFMAVLMLILALPLAMPVVSVLTQKRRDADKADLLLKTPILYEEDVERQDSVHAIMEGGKADPPRWVTVAAATEAEAVSLRKLRKGPHRGEDFTLLQALRKADFWLLFWALVCGGGAGLTVIDNMGQIAEARGYTGAHLFVSMISIWNFLGRIAGGFASEILARHRARPRPLALAAAQVAMAAGQALFASGFPGSIHAGTLLVGLAYGAHWSIVPATASELFGVRNFGAIYNFITMANPAGSLLFSGVIAGGIYDTETDRQRRHAGDSEMACHGSRCFFLTHVIMVGVCLMGVVLSLIMSYRTVSVYNNLYRTAAEDDHHDKSQGQNQAHVESESNKKKMKIPGAAAADR